MLLEAVTHVVIDKAPSAGTSPLTWLPAVTAVIAAVSAYLSWRSVTQAKEIFDRSLLPVLAPVLSVVGDKLVLSVTNTSKTVAAGAGWAALWGDRRNEAHLPDRALMPDKVSDPIELMDVRAGIDDVAAAPGPIAIAWCRDQRGDLHVWDSDHNHLKLVKEQSTKLKPADLLGRFRSDKAAKEATHVGSASRLVPYV